MPCIQLPGVFSAHDGIGRCYIVVTAIFMLNVVNQKHNAGESADAMTQRAGQGHGKIGLGADRRSILDLVSANLVKSALYPVQICFISIRPDADKLSSTSSRLRHWPSPTQACMYSSESGGLHCLRRHTKHTSNLPSASLCSKALRKS